MQYAIHSQILVLTQDKIGSPSCSEGKGVTATNQHILKKTMSSTRILSLVLCILSLQQQHTNAFTDRLIVRTPRFSTAASFSPKSSTPLNWARPQRDKECREHKALSIPFSGPPVDYRDHNQSWNDDCNLTSQPTSDCFDAAPSQKALLAGIVSAGALGFYALLTMSSPGSWRYFVAGGICAATSHSIPTPIDVIKTRKQVDPSLQSKSFVEAAKEIVKREGFSSLWAGLGPTAWGYLFEGALKFGVYEVLKPFMKKTLAHLASIWSLGILNSQLLAYMLCGVASGFAASLMLCPMEAIRIRMVADPDFAPQGWVAVGCKMLRTEGIAGLSKGMTPMISKQVPYTVTKNVSFDILTRSFYAMLKAQGMALTSTIMFAVPLVSAAIASILSTITSQPGDLVLSLVNAKQDGRSAQQIFRDTAKSDKGIRSFFVGFNARLLHVGVSVTVQLLVYDYAKRLCGIAATGSC